MKTLIAGWFSFEGMGATAGDLLAGDLAREWLVAAGHDCDVALVPPFAGGVDWQAVDPAAYDTVVFVCGPFGNGAPVTEFLAYFAGRRLVGLNLSMLDTLENWNPFDVLFERDSSANVRPDISFLASRNRAPVVGRILVHHQGEYRRRGRHVDANAAIDRLLTAREAAIVPIDTRLDSNAVGLRTPAEVEGLIARMDVVVTTRLHGTVLALKHGVPVVAIDPIAGGAKLRCQAETIGWPLIFNADALDDAALAAAFDYCLTPAARDQARACGAAAAATVRALRTEFITALAHTT